MTRKLLAAGCFVVSVALHIAKLHGRLDDANLFLLPLSVCWVAFILPGIGFVGQFERHVLGYQPWGAEHGTTSMLCAFAVAALVWFFPVARIERWFGTFDPFTEGKRRFPHLPSLSGAAANVLDKVSRLRVGKGKMGGWA
jgi:hypothetical protein